MAGNKSSAYRGCPFPWHRLYAVSNPGKDKCRSSVLTMAQKTKTGFERTGPVPYQWSHDPERSAVVVQPTCCVSSLRHLGTSNSHRWKGAEFCCETTIARWWRTTDFPVQVESIINARPITTNTDDPSDLEPLAPNHLLLLKKQLSMAATWYGH